MLAATACDSDCRRQQSVERGKSSDGGGGRSWWAHFEFTPVNTGLIILTNQIEEKYKEKGRVSLSATRF